MLVVAVLIALAAGAALMLLFIRLQTGSGSGWSRRAVLAALRDWYSCSTEPGSARGRDRVWPRAPSGLADSITTLRLRRATSPR